MHNKGYQITSIGIYSILKMYSHLHYYLITILKIHLNIIWLWNLFWTTILQCVCCFLISLCKIPFGILIDYVSYFIWHNHNCQLPINLLHQIYLLLTIILYGLLFYLYLLVCSIFICFVTFCFHLIIYLFYLNWNFTICICLKCGIVFRRNIFCMIFIVNIELCSCPLLSHLSCF